jgi:hypothetical protein
VYAGFACQISNTSEWKKSSIELEKVNLPNTAWKPAQKSLIVASTSSTVPPSVLEARRGIVAAIPHARAPLPGAFSDRIEDGVGRLPSASSHECAPMAFATPARAAER